MVAFNFVFSNLIDSDLIENEKNNVSIFWAPVMSLMGFPGGSDIKNPPSNAEDSDSIPDLGRSPGKGNSCLEIPWWEEPGGLQAKESEKT